MSDTTSRMPKIDGNLVSLKKTLGAELIIPKPPEVSFDDIERPSYKTYKNDFTVNGKKMEAGLYWHANYQKNKMGETYQIDEWISSPIWIVAITSTTQASDFGRFLIFTDSNGKEKKWAMPMESLKSGMEEILGELFRQGLTCRRKQRTLLHDFIMESKPNRRITAATQIGWHEDSFVLPNQIIGNEDEVIFQSETICDDEIVTKGTLEAWREQIAKYCIGNIPLTLSFCTMFASPMLKLLNKQNGTCFHLVGDSSAGKSTATEAAATIWGPPEFIKSWRATANGLEGIAANRNDLGLILEEINEAEPSELRSASYMLCNGMGKQRAASTGDARKIKRWRLMTLSSGEDTLENILKKVNIKINSGQLVRIMNIPVTFKHGAFNELHVFKNGREFSDYLKTARLKNYGHAGPEFLKRLVEDIKISRDFLAEFEEINNQFTTKTSSPLEARGATHFAVLAFAGELAIQYRILPWAANSAIETCEKALQLWREYQGKNQTEDERIINNLRNFINAHGDSRFSPLNMAESIDTKTVHNRAGWYKDEAGVRVYMFFPETLAEAGGYDKRRVSDALICHGLIVAKDSDRNTKKTTTPSGEVRLYHLSLSQLEDKN